MKSPKKKKKQKIKREIMEKSENSELVVKDLEISVGVKSIHNKKKLVSFSFDISECFPSIT